MVWNWLFTRQQAAEPSIQLANAMRMLNEQSVSCVLLKAGEGKSKIGGAPRGLSAEDWPSCDDKPLSFLVQLDLREVRDANGPDWLPNEGRLFFFYDADEQPWGFNPSDRGRWRVIHQRTESPQENAADQIHRLNPTAFAEKAVFLIGGRSTPDSDRVNLDLDHMSTLELDCIWEAGERQYGGQPAHQIGGFPAPIQGDDMELQAQLASNGVYCGDPSGYDNPRAKALSAQAKDWVLLLQLDTDDDTGMMWGDGGRLYFWIREQDARSLNFNDVWLVLQCS